VLLGLSIVPLVATWIYEEWWSETPGSSVSQVADLLRAHLALNRMPSTLVAFLDRLPVGTASLLEHDVGTEEWPDLSPWLAALYVVPEYRERGIGAALVNAIIDTAGELRAERLYLLTVGREGFYADLDWKVLERAGEKRVMTYHMGSSPSADPDLC
jgi:GNAT superfamily N-acetyltransferase